MTSPCSMQGENKRKKQCSTVCTLKNNSWQADQSTAITIIVTLFLSFLLLFRVKIHEESFLIKSLSSLLLFLLFLAHGLKR